METRVIRGSDAKATWLLLAMVAVFVVGLFSHDHDSLRAVVGRGLTTLFCPVVAVVAFMMLLFPSTLTLTTEGFEIRVLRHRPRFVRWSDVAEVRVDREGYGFRRYDQPVWIAAKGGRRHPLDGFWRESPAQLVEAMQAYHRAALAAPTD